MIAVMAVVLFAATALLMVPTASADEGDRAGAYADIRAESYLVGTGKPIEYKVFGTDPNGGNVSFTAKVVDSDGKTVGSVSPSTRNSIEENGTVLSITAPNDPGMYTLTVEFTFTGDNDEKFTVTKTAPLKVVVPIKLSATINNEGGTVVNMKVRFVVSTVGVIDDSEQEIEVAAKGSRTVTYDWVTETLPNGKYTMHLEGTVGPTGDQIKGLNEPTVFHVGQTSYTLVEALVVILFIVLVLILIWVLRKPVKNVGKPKGRR
jgi:hypothetical protein